MKILFVCTGNTCRSPLAEVIARREVIDRGWLDVEVESAGTSAWDGSPASDGSLLVGLEHGLDLGGHHARLLTPEIVSGADLILTMSHAHLERVEMIGGEDKVWLVSEYARPGEASRAIADPIGGDLDDYRTTYGQLHGYIRSIFDRLAVSRGRAVP